MFVPQLVLNVIVLVALVLEVLLIVFLVKVIFICQEIPVFLIAISINIKKMQLNQDSVEILAKIVQVNALNVQHLLIAQYVPKHFI